MIHSATRGPTPRTLARAFAVLAAIALAVAACSSSGTVSDMPDYKPPQTPTDLTTLRYATTADVVAAVVAAQGTRALPSTARKQLVALSQVARTDSSAEQARPENCLDERQTPFSADYTILGECAYGDPDGTKLMVVYGDSLAPMWTTTLERVAAVTGWKVRMFSRGGCPPTDLQFRNMRTGGPDTRCDDFHATTLDEINTLRPRLVITVGSADRQLVDGQQPSPDQWREGWMSTFRKLARPGTRVAMLGSLPTWTKNDAQCLAGHLQDVQACSIDSADAVPEYAEAERAAAAATGTQYVDPAPWVCARTCQPVIADTIVFYNPVRLTKEYAAYISGAVAEALAPVMR